MVSLTLNKAQLFKDLEMEDPKLLPHHMAMLGIDVENDEKDKFVVDITPNRPDLLSQAGITRALSSILNIKPGLREYAITKSKLKVKVEPSAKEIRPYTACAVAKNMNLDDEKLKELIDIQEKLHVTFCRKRKRAAIGVYPMEAINGNITFKALPPEQIKFRPLESKKTMTAKEMLKKHPKGREYAHLMKGLTKYPLFVDSKGKVLSMPPIINSQHTGKVTTKTKEIFMESSGHDLRICHEIMQMMCAALADMGATIQSVDVTYGKKTLTMPDMSTKKQEFYGYYVNRRLGTNIKKEEFQELLSKMGLGFEEGRIRETYYALIPPYRVDFIHQIDVVEDIAIAFGYENINPELPEVSTVASESSMTLFTDKMRDILTGYGLIEAKNYHLISREYQEEIQHGNFITLKSSVSEEYDSLRLSIFTCLLQTLTKNKVHEYPQQLFEIGKVFSLEQDIVMEMENLGIVLAGEVDYTSIRQVVDGLLLGLGLSGTFTPVDDIRFLKGRCAKLMVDETEVGILGEVSPRALSIAEILVPVAAAELKIEELMKISMK